MNEREARTKYIAAHSAVVNCFNPTDAQWQALEDAEKAYAEATEGEAKGGER